jgi:hypothetical protein
MKIKSSLFVFDFNYKYLEYIQIDFYLNPQSIYR